jgi:polysaccharide biosynthesis/export protein
VQRSPRCLGRDKLRNVSGAIVASLISLGAVHVLGCGAAVSRPPAADDAAHQAEVARLLRERSQPADRANYVIGPGDKIDVRAENLQELTGTWQVSEEGAVVFPLLGSVKLAGSTEREAAERIRGQLAELMVEPQITLSVREFHGQQVSVVGAVGKPGVYAIRGFDETIVDVITEAGGVNPDAATHMYFTPGTDASDAAGNQAAARLTIGGPPGSFGAKNKAVSIDVAPLYRGQEVPALRIPVRGGDVILVPQSGEVYVDGWVNAPGAFSVTHAHTLSEAIVNAGDLHFAASTGPLTLQRADADGEVKTYRIDYQRILSGQDSDLPLDTGDKIQVASNPVKVVPWAVYALFKGIVTLGVGGSQSKVYNQ